MPRLSFIILAWNSEQYLRGCFDSILEKCRTGGISCEVIVVDNGSTDGTRQIIGDYLSGYGAVFRAIFLDRNRGTTLPRNLALRQARGSCVCILDSDTCLGDGDLVTLLETLEGDGSLGIIAPRLVLGDGTIQNSVKKFPTFLVKLLKIAKALLGIPVPDHDFYGDFPFERERYVDSAISACWFFRRDLLDTVGMLDEKIFYAPEDVDYSLRVWQAGWSILYDPSVTVVHYTQQISHRRPLSLISLRHFAGLFYYFRKHGGWVTAPRFTSPLGLSR